MDSAFLAFAVLPIVLVAVTVGFSRRKNRRTTWKTLLAVNTLVLASLLSVGFIFGETYFRFIHDTTEATTSTLTSKAWYARHWQTNSFAFRDIEWPPTAPGKCPVFVLGDSFTAGYGIKDVEKRFANIIRARHPEWSLYIMAYPGVGTVGEIGWLKGMFVPGGHYEQDTFVSVYNRNDIEDVAGGEWVNGVAEIMNDRFRQSWLCQHSYFINLFYNRWQQRRNPKVQGVYPALEAAYDGPIWERQAALLRELQRLVESHGAKLLVVTFPDLHAMGKDYGFRVGHDRLQKFWADQGVAHLDLLPIFKDRSPKEITVNRHDAHPNELAHQLAAEAMDTFLKEQMSK